MCNILKISFLVVFFIFWVGSVFAGKDDTIWVRRYDDALHSSDNATALAVDRDGNVFVTGTCEESDDPDDFTTIKYNPDGEVQWVRHYDTPGWVYDEAKAISLDEYGNSYVIGDNTLGGQDCKFTTIGYNLDGDTLWWNTYDYSNGWDGVRAIATDGYSYVYVTGKSERSGPLSVSDQVIIKYYASNGDVQWSRRYDINDSTLGEPVALDFEGGFLYAAGFNGNKLYSFMTVAKYDTSNGDTVWTRLYGGYPARFATDLAIDSSGNVYVTGGWVGALCTTVKYNANGDLIWVDDENASYYPNPKIALDRCGNVYLTVAVDYSDYKTVKYSSSGELEWTRYYDGPAHDQDEPSDIVVDRFGNVYVTGYSRGIGTYADYATIKYDTWGNELWVKRYNGPGNDYDEASAIAVDDSGNVCVTGRSIGSGTYTDYATIKYIQSPPSYYTPAMIVSWATNGGTTQDSMKFKNFGQDTLFVQLSGPSWVTSITPANFYITGCGLIQTVNLIFNGAGFIDTLLVDSLKILSNHNVLGGGEVYTDTEWVKIHFVVSNSYYPAEYDTVSQFVRVTVSNVGNLGNEEIGNGMNYNGHDYLDDFTPVFVTPDIGGLGPKGYTWLHNRHDFLPEGHLQVHEYPNLKCTVSKDKFALINSTLSPPWHWWWPGWTHFSLSMNSKYNFKIPPDAITIHNLKAIVVYDWWIHNPPPVWWCNLSGSSAPAGGYFGIAADWDVPSEAFDKNIGGYIDTSNLIWLTSDYYSYDDYYGAFQFLGASVTKNGDTTNYTAPYGAHVLTNAEQLYPLGGYNDDSLYKYMSMPGWSLPEPNTAQNMNIIMPFIQDLYPDTTTVIALRYALLLTDQGITEKNSISDIVRRVKPGDANVDGKVSVSDVVYLINYLFKGGPEPWCAYSDANGDAKISVSDVVYLINYLFKGGPPPVLIWYQTPPW